MNALTEVQARTSETVSEQLTDLVAISAEFYALEQEYWDVNLTQDRTDDPKVKQSTQARLYAIGDRQRHLEDLAVDIPAWTPEQLQAKALIIHCRVTNNPDLVDASPAVCEDNLAWSLCQDLLVPTQDGPDRALLTLHAEFRDTVEALRKHEADDTSNAPDYDGNADDAVFDDLVARIWALRGRILEAEAYTTAGRQAKAAVALYAAQLRMAGDGEVQIDLLIKALAGVIGSAVVPFEGKPS